MTIMSVQLYVVVSALFWTYYIITFNVSVFPSLGRDKSLPICRWRFVFKILKFTCNWGHHDFGDYCTRHGKKKLRKK